MKKSAFASLPCLLAAALIVCALSGCAGSGSLQYDNGVHFIRTFQEDGSISEEIQYKDGTGTFSLLGDGELIWTDEKDHVADDTSFLALE